MSNYNQNVYYYRFTFLPIKLEDGFKFLKSYEINDHCYWGNMNYDVESFILQAWLYTGNKKLRRAKEKRMQ